jgi:hypothetical protein
VTRGGRGGATVVHPEAAGQVSWLRWSRQCWWQLACRLPGSVRTVAHESKADSSPTPVPSSGTKFRVAPSAPAESSHTRAFASPVNPSPPALRIPTSGSGEFAVARVGEVVASGDSLDYAVEVERSLPFAVRAVAVQIRLVFQDPRGWTAVDETAFRQVSSDHDLRVLVATPSTTDRLCRPLQTRGRVSCRNGGLVV